MVKVAVRMPSAIGDPGEFLADVRALEAAGADGLWFSPEGEGGWLLLGAVAEATHRIRIGLDGGPHAAVTVATLDKLAGGRVLVSVPAGERWSDVPVPRDRDSWSANLHQNEEAGSTGVIVPWDPRLIDLLRNRGEDDRSDLLMSTG